MPKISLLTQDTAPTDDDLVVLVDQGPPKTTKHATRGHFLAGSPILDPTLKGSSDGELFSGKHSGWVDPLVTFTVASGYNKGNKSFELTVASDVSGMLSPGMRLRLTRNTAAPTQCADFESGSSQHATDTTISGITFTDDWSAEAWVKLESYDSSGAAHRTIISRRNGTVSGFGFRISNDGRVTIYGGTGSAFDTATSVDSIPLDRWVHVAATLDLSAATGTIYINGTSVPVVYSNTAATSITQAGDLFMGTIAGGGEYFDGKLADVRLWNAIRTATQIRDNMNQQLVGSETNLVGYWKLNGNFNDSTANANNLTAVNGAIATSADNPFSDIQYAIITKVAYSAPNTTVTVFTGTDHVIPNMTLNTPYFSPHRAPYGFPNGRDKWEVLLKSKYDVTAIVAAGSWGNPAGHKIEIPIGAWEVHLQACTYQQNSSSAVLDMMSALSTSDTTATDDRLIARARIAASVTTTQRTAIHLMAALNLAAATNYYLIVHPVAGAGTISVGFDGVLQATTVTAICAYA